MKNQGMNERLIRNMVEFRRWMHQNPELSENEEKTSEHISRVLSQYGIEHKKNIGGYGIEAIIRGGHSGITVGAKSDMDALPIVERNHLPFKSVNPGVMHACGHDANTAILLGTAITLEENKKKLNGNVKLFFEPAEETIGGGDLMVKEGCMEDPRVDYIVGLHLMPYLETGMVEVKRGCMNASTDEVEITVFGKGGHAAEPQICVDPIVVISYIITSMQTLISRNTDPTDATVLTFGILQAGTKGNIIPDTAFAKGTLRNINPEQRDYSKKRIAEIAESVAKGFGAEAEVKITDSYDAVINDEEIVDLIEDEAVDIFGREAVVNMPKPSMGAEDFSYYMKKARGAYFHIGCKKQGEDSCNLHTATFDLDEKAIENGIRLQSAVLMRLLEENLK